MIRPRWLLAQRCTCVCSCPRRSFSQKVSEEQKIASKVLEELDLSNETPGSINEAAPTIKAKGTQRLTKRQQRVPDAAALSRSDISIMRKQLLRSIKTEDEAPSIEAVSHEGHRDWDTMRRQPQPDTNQEEAVRKVRPERPRRKPPAKKAVVAPKEMTEEQASMKQTANMLYISGLSPNVTAADFYRIAPNGLSSWQSNIKKVVQVHNRRTLEPTGRFAVSFNDYYAAKAYRDNLERLHRLAKHKHSHPTGLWESTIPPHLRGPKDDIKADLASFTIAPATQPALEITQARTSCQKWEQALTKLIEPLGYGATPPVVVIQVYPPSLSAEALGRQILLDGLERDLRWKVSAPVAWLQPTGFTPKAGEEEKQPTDTRFVLACEAEWDARRFHRNWNQRMLVVEDDDGRAHRYIVHASVLNW